MIIFDVLTATAVILNLVLLTYAIYNAGLALFLFKKIQPLPEAATQNRFAVLIAARDEAAVISSLIESLKQQNYPASRFEIIVIPNNCTDRTEQIARQAGARILKCPSQVKSKGDVLNFAFPELSRKEQDFDAICVVDADNLVDPDFLKEMNKTLSSGKEVAQGHRKSKNPSDNGISGSYFIYYWIYNRFISKARFNAGLSIPVIGSGFMISTGLIRRMKDKTFKTLLEDMELTILCYLAGVKVALAPDAIVYDEHPLSFRQSWDQRARWSGGIYQISKIYFGPILRQVRKTKSLQGLDLMFLNLVTHMSVLGFLSFIVYILLILFGLMEHQIAITAVWSVLILSTLSSWILMTGGAFVVTCCDKISLSKIWRGILTFWFFILSWQPINIICLFHIPKTWKKIRHDRDISLQDIS